MKDSLAFDVVVPNPWRLVGRLFIIACVAVCALFFFRLRYPNDNVDHLFVINGVMGCLFTAFLIPVFMPCFIGKYPNWVVVLFGRPFLVRLMTDCTTMIGRDREIKASFRDRSNWLQDQRVMWLLVIFGAMMAGISLALS